MTAPEVREVTELITPGPAEALAGLLGVPCPGEELPLLMAELARSRAPAGSEYAYRMFAPLYEHQGLVVAASSDGNAVRVSCRDAADRVTATGEIS